MDYLSSMYIDNEMDLDDKRRFLEKVHSDHAFYSLTLALLAQEQQLRWQPMPVDRFEEKRWRPPVRSVLAHLFKPLGFAAAGFTVAVLMLAVLFQGPAAPLCTNRFVLFEPSANQVEVAGTFTGWQRIAMQRAGDSGYWQLELQIPTGEHRFAYILDGDRRMPDPTLAASEMDDFGGENSIINVEERI